MIVSTSSDLALEAALKRCASEQVHIPECIQGHGAIIAVDNRTLQVTHASSNLASIVGLDIAAVLGKNINDVFPAELRHDLVNGLLTESSMQENRTLGNYKLVGKRFGIASAAAKNATIFEFEAVGKSSNLDRKAVDHLELLTSQLQNVQDKKTLFDKSVMLLKILTGYQQVMVYEFDAEGNGKVQAEALSGPGQSFLGLNFPAWDIPQQARDIMSCTLFRYIADVNAQPICVLASGNDDTPLNMTFAHLRGVSRVHLEYLKNMGRSATFTLNIMVSGQLWGMISLHNSAARYPDQSIREVCRNFARFFALKLETILQHERLERLNQAELLRKKLVDTAASSRSGSMFDAELLKLLCAAMNADGMMLASDGDIQNIGLCAPPECLDNFLHFGRNCEEGFHSSSVCEDLENYTAICGSEIAGLHVTQIPENGFVAFFRRDREYATTWAGVPKKEIEGDGETFKLNPRASFEAYKTTVRGTAIPWTIEEHQIASDIWAILISSERNALIEKTTRQQQLLIAELNHRVRNMLSMIRSLSRQSQSTAVNIDDYIQTLDARIEAVASAHSLAVEKAGSSVSVYNILELEAAPHNNGSTSIHVSGDDIGVRPDVAPIFALVIHELMTNAAKFGALSKASGRVDIVLKPSNRGLDLHWKEKGGPKAARPVHKGFGSVLLSNAIPNELRGKYKAQFLDTGFEATIALPEEILSQKRYVTSFDTSKAVFDGPPSVTASSKKPRDEMQCLLVEDNFVVSMDTTRILNEVGFRTVDTALTKQDGLQSLRRTKPDFAVLDISLSGGDTSFGIAEELKKLGLPFVFATGYGDDGVPREKFPYTPVLKKPVLKAALESVLQEMCL